MFIFEILIYVFFALVMYYLANRYRECKELSEDGWNGYLIGYMAFYVVICAIRYNVGVDCLSYIKIFERGIIDDFRLDDEMLWNAIVRTVYSWGLGSVVGLGICAFIQIYFIVTAIKRYPLLLVMLPLVLFGGRYFLDLNAAVRQMTAACILFWGTKFIISKNPVKYFITVFIASFIHHSALMLLPFYFIPNKLCIASRRNLMLIILAVCVIAGQTPSFQGLIEYASSLANLTGYSGYADRVETFMSEGTTAEALSFGPMMLSYLLISVALIWFGDDLKRHYFENNPILNLWYTLAFFYGCSYFLIANISHIFIRPVMYFGIYQLISASLLLGYFWQRRNDTVHFRRLFWLFLIIIWVNISWDIIKSYTNPWNATTYKVSIIR